MSSISSKSDFAAEVVPWSDFTPIMKLGPNLLATSDIPKWLLTLSPLICMSSDTHVATDRKGSQYVDR